MNSYEIVKCDGGAVGLILNPAALKRYYKLVEFMSHIEDSRDFCVETFHCV